MITTERSRIGSAMVVIAVLAVLLAAVSGLQAAPFAKTISFTQPDGTAIELWGKGDEFYANFETMDGYTAVFDQTLKAYCYAELAADESQLVSTGIQVHRGDPEALGLSQHLRLGQEAVNRQVQERYALWNAATETSQRWSQLKAARQLAASGMNFAPPGITTTGTRAGVCLLIDFDDDPATVPQAEIVDFCNGDHYAGYGNNGSVKKYFQDNSGGLLTYSNVVTIYLRIPNSLHPKSYYNDTSRNCGDQANLLIQDAIAIMKALTNYDTGILPTFDALTVDANDRVVACNVFYAGGNGGVWNYGLWPHSWSLYNVGAQELSPGGKMIWNYQISNIGSYLEIGTFCHENGHMLCGYPDIYDYGHDSAGGAGFFCLMNDGADGGYPYSGSNPVQICAYLKQASGWATTTELTNSSSLLAVVSAAGTNFNHFYRYQKPDVATEYFLMECRYATGRDASLPASGVAVWHIDELGDHNNQSLITNSTHANYEVTLVQADGLWDFENNTNDGDDCDLYHSGNPGTNYNNTLSDESVPAANWWDGSASGVNFHDFSSRETVMSFIAGAAPFAPVILLAPTNQAVQSNTAASLSVAAGGSFPMAYQWRFNGMNLAGATNSTLTLTKVNSTNAGHYSVVVSNLYGSTASPNAALALMPVMVKSLKNSAAITIPDSGAASPYPSAITVSGVTGTVLKTVVQLAMFTHASPDDLDVLLVGPQGQSALLMSDAGGTNGLSYGWLTFDNAAAVPLPDDAPITNGFFLPTDFEPGDVFPSPAPAGPYGTALATFKGTDPNGIWQLYVYDDTAGGSGSIAAGWGLQLSIPTSPVFLPPVVSGGQMELQFAAAAGVQYVVEYRDSLNASTWQTLQTVNGDNLVHTIQDPVAAAPQRFYRIRLQ
jgi:M6 family metalloprotease-like protein